MLLPRLNPTSGSISSFSGFSSKTARPSDVQRFNTSDYSQSVLRTCNSSFKDWIQVVPDVPNKLRVLSPVSVRLRRRGRNQRQPELAVVCAEVVVQVKVQSVVEKNDVKIVRRSRGWGGRPDKQVTWMWVL